MFSVSWTPPCNLGEWWCTDLRVADHDDLGVGARLDVRLDLLGDGLGAGLDRGAVLAVACRRVVDGFGCGAGVGVLDQVDDGAGGAEARGDGGFARAEDVDVGAGGALGDVLDGRGQGAAGEEEESGGGGVHNERERNKERVSVLWKKEG